LGDGPKLSERVVDERDRRPRGGSDMPAAAQEVDLAVGVDPASQMERQMQVEQRCRGTGTNGRALFGQGFLPGGIGAEARGAADGAILSFKLPVEHDLRSGIIVNLFIGQDGHQPFLHGAKAALDLAFGLGTGSDQMGDPEGGEGALELGAGIAVIGHGIVTKEAEAVGIHHQWQAVLAEEPAKMLEVIPGRIRGDKDRAQKLAGMIIHCQQQGLLFGGRPPLVDGGIVLPQFANP
jgi:hypothetical protein